jgi:large subunit ribosomal protein L22
MSYKASHRFARISAQKVRPFADLIRGKFVDEAMELLGCYPNRGAKLIMAVLESARRNAEDLGCRDYRDLEVSSVLVDSGPIISRFRPKARGSANPIKKRMSHISVVLE